MEALMAVVVVSLLLLKWNEIKYRRNGLPPGTMGWPLVGETTEFLKLGSNFMKQRRSRYGSVFTTHFLGCPMVFWMDPELNRREFDKLYMGTLSLPINIPGTHYHLGFQGRKNILKILSQLLKERRANSSAIYNDLLSKLMEESRYPLTDKEIIDQVITKLYSGYETVSTTSMMAVKYVTDHSQVLQELRDEHLAIRSRKTPVDSIEWDDYKAMRLTRADGRFTYTLEKSTLIGFFSQSHWLSIHGDEQGSGIPQLLLPFRRWREIVPREGVGHSFYLYIFLHYFVTKYRWEDTGGNELVQFPRVEAPNGLQYEVSSY